MDSNSTTPSVMYILFERGVLIGAFTKLDAAERTRDARKAAGRPKARLVKFLADPDDDHTIPI